MDDGAKDYLSILSKDIKRTVKNTNEYFLNYSLDDTLIDNFVNKVSKSDVIVVIFPDHGSRYLSKIYSDKWMENQGFSDSKREINNNDIQYIRK